MALRGGFAKYAVLFGVVVLVAGLIGWLSARRMAEAPAPAPPETVKESLGSSKQQVHLYFSDAQGAYLTAERQFMDRPADNVLFGRRLIEALIKGPQKGGGRTLPADASLRAVYILDDGTAVVDFHADAMAHHPGGIGCELLSLYSVVNTLILNIEAIRSVKVLIGGNEADVLVDQVDLSGRNAADMLWVR